MTESEIQRLAELMAVNSTMSFVDGIVWGIAGFFLALSVGYLFVRFMAAIEHALSDHEIDFEYCRACDCSSCLAYRCQQYEKIEEEGT